MEFNAMENQVPNNHVQIPRAPFTPGGREVERKAPKPALGALIDRLDHDSASAAKELDRLFTPTRRGRPLPWSLREEIQARAAAGESRRQIARVMGVARDTVKRYSQRV